MKIQVVTIIAVLSAMISAGSADAKHLPKPITAAPVPPRPVMFMQAVGKPAIKKPPVKQYRVILQNDAGAPIYFTVNGSEAKKIEDGKYHTLQTSSKNGMHDFYYHNGHKVVHRHLSNTGHFSFRWQGDTLMMIDLQK